MLNGIIWKNRVCPSHKKSAPLGVKKKCPNLPPTKSARVGKKSAKTGALTDPSEYSSSIAPCNFRDWESQAV